MTLADAIRNAVKAEIELALASITPGADGYYPSTTDERKRAEQAWKVLAEELER